MYKCSACDFKSDYRSNVAKHLNKVKKCSTNKLEIIDLNVKMICEHCNKVLSDKNSKTRHLKNCKIKQIEELENKVAELDDKLKTFVKSNDESNKSTATNINSNNTTNNTTNNTVINNYITISLTPYNDPNMEGMRKYLEAALRKTFLSVPNLVESVHFNDKYPENKNICITNKRTNDAKVFDGEKWKTMNKDTLLTEIVDTYERELNNYAEEQGNKKYINNYEKAKKRGNAEKDLIDEVQRTIHDNRKKVNTKINEVQKVVDLSELNQEFDLEEDEDEDEDEDEFE